MEGSLSNEIGIRVEPRVLDLNRLLRASLVWGRAHVTQLICAGVLLVMFGQLLAVISRKSVTVDELVLIPAGYYHVVTTDFSLIREHPPLCKFLAGLPILFIQPDEPIPDQKDREMPRIDFEWKYAMSFWGDNLTRADSIAFWARVPMIMLSLGLGLVVFMFTRDLFGDWAAVFAVALFSLEPTVLAHARVVQTDIPATFGFLLTAFSLRRYLRDRTMGLAIALGVSASIAALAKFSMVIVVPILAVVFLVLIWTERERRRAILLHALVCGSVILFIINAAYFFNHNPISEEDSQWIITSFPRAHAWVALSVRLFRFLLPTDYIIGVYWQLNHTNNGHPSSLLGMYGRTGWWYYYQVAFALKTTLPFLLLSITSLFWAFYKLVRKTEFRLLFVLIPFTLYTVLLMMSPIAIGIRYYLPAFPFLFALGGGMLDFLRRRANGRLASGSMLVVVIAFGWMSIEALRAFPNHMPYMNQLASSRPHWWYLSDSNVEWGDDLKELASYLHAKGETRVLTMALGDFLTPSFYGIQRFNLLGPPVHPTPKYTALGASFLNGSTVLEVINGKVVSEEERVNWFDSFRRRTPEAVIGNSIYVYRTDN